MTLQELIDRRNKLAADMRALHDKAEKEDRGFSSDEDSQWAKMRDDINDLDSRIQRAQTFGVQSAPQPGVTGSNLRAAGQQGGDEREADPEMAYRSAFDAYLRDGFFGLQDEQRNLLRARQQDMSKEARAFSAGTSNVGGYTVPQGFRDQLEVAMKAFGGMLNVGEILRTDSGNALPMPTFNYTGVVASIVGENTGGNTDTSTPFGQASLGAYTYRTPILPVSFEFLQDSAFGEGYITNALGEALGRGINAHLTTGTGTGQPRGIITDSVSGKVGTTGQTTTVLFDDLIDLEYAVDPAYRVGAKFMFHDSTLKALQKLKDSQNRPLWLPGYAVGEPNSILGYEYQINMDMPVMAANAKSILFGRLDKYKIRLVRDVIMLRLSERYAEQGSVAFLLFQRADGRLLDAGTNPVKYYQNSAS